MSIATKATIMYIKSINFDNLRCFENFSVDLEEGMSLLILGENGGGKSTVLRAIAMGICDQSSSASLFRELPGEFVRRKKGEEWVPKGTVGKILVDLVDTEGAFEEVYRIPTTITSLDQFERVQQFDKIEVVGSATEKKLDDAQFPWAKVFVSGYGAGARTNGSADYRHYLPVDAIYSLFNYGVPLQNPELAVRRLKDAAEASTEDPDERKKRSEGVVNAVKGILAKLLVLDEADSIVLEPTGIVVYGRWGRAELGELGDGYKAIITMVLDLVSWWFLHVLANDEEEKGWLDFDAAEIKGIVIIDEVEQHLHPRWQKIIIELLLDCFPKVQFIITSHSPLCVVGASSANGTSERLKTVVLRNRDDKVEPRVVPPAKDQRADQVLTGIYFGLDTAYDSAVKEKIARYSELLNSSSLDEGETEELATLTSDLDRVLGAGETELEDVVSEAIDYATKKLSDKVDAKVVNYEVLRQIHDKL